MIALTTTAAQIDEELLNRCLVLTIDEGRAQTQAIHAAQRLSDQPIGQPGVLGQQRAVQIGSDHVRARPTQDALAAIASVVAVAAQDPAGPRIVRPP